MKNFLRLLTFFLLLFSYINFSNAFSLGDIFSESSPEIHYCNDGECWIDKWIDAAGWVDWLVTDKKASVYFTNVVVYLLWFIYLIAISIIIYAWFNLLVWAWNEDKAKKTKTMIIYVVAWITIMFLAAPIVNFVIKILETANTTV